MDDKGRPSFISGGWLILATFVLLGAGLLLWIARPFGLSQLSVLSVLALLGGFIYAFTNANDQRVLAKRRVLKNGIYELYDENTSGFLTPHSFVALAGFLGAIFTWMLLPTIYFGFGAASQKSSKDFLSDLLHAASFSILGIPSFIILGILSIIATIAYLRVVRKSLLHLVFPTIATTSITVSIGALFFDDSLVDSQLLFPFLLMCFLVFVLSKKAAMQRHQSACMVSSGETNDNAQKFPSWINLSIFVSVDVARNLVIRNSLHDLSGSNQFFVAICLRSLYFSVFFVYALAYLLHARARRQILSTLKRPAKMILCFFKNPSRGRVRVVLITSITFVCAYAISTPTFACNLALSPILFTASQIMAFPILEAYYCNGGVESSFLERLLRVFGKHGTEDKMSKVFFVSNFLSYVLSWVTCILWISLNV